MVNRSKYRRACSLVSSAFLPLLGLCVAIVAYLLLPRSGPSLGQHPNAPANDKRPSAPAPALELRMGLEQLRNPFWYEQHGQPQESKDFWDKNYWDRALRQWSDEGY